MEDIGVFWKVVREEVIRWIDSSSPAAPLSRA
jgi:hypothetical protein